MVTPIRYPAPTKKRRVMLTEHLRHIRYLVVEHCTSTRFSPFKLRDEKRRSP